MSGVKHTPWNVEDCGSPEYLDGIQSRYTVCGRGKMPIAYAFDADEARLIAAAPDLLEVASQPVVHIVEGDETIVRLMIGKVEVCAYERGDWRATALIMFDAEQRAAITRATGDRPEKGENK